MINEKITFINMKEKFISKRISIPHVGNIEYQVNQTKYQHPTGIKHYTTIVIWRTNTKRFRINIQQPNNKNLGEMIQKQFGENYDFLKLYKTLGKYIEQSYIDIFNELRFYMEMV